MLQNFLKAKLHHARVTGVELEYEGSCAIDQELMQAVGILENEQIHIYNLNNGERWVTYAITAPAGSRIISIGRHHEILGRVRALKSRVVCAT